jgi:hypothetical protein
MKHGSYKLNKNFKLSTIEPFFGTKEKWFRVINPKTKKKKIGKSFEINLTPTITNFGAIFWCFIHVFLTSFFQSWTCME